MFGRAGKIRRAIAKSVKAAREGAGPDAFKPIEALADGEKVDAYVDACHQLIFEEDLVAADKAIDRALALAPTELYVLDAKSEVAVEDGRLADALAIYRQMYEIDSNDPAVLAGLGQLLLRNDDPDGALALLEPHARSEDPYLQLRYAEVLYAVDRVAEALERLQTVRAHYAAALKRATFVDNPQEIKRHIDEATRLHDDIVGALEQGGAPDPS